MTHYWIILSITYSPRTYTWSGMVGLPLVLVIGNAPLARQFSTNHIIYYTLFDIISQLLFFNNGGVYLLPSSYSTPTISHIVATAVLTI